MLTIKLTRDEARLVERALCETLDAIRHDIKRGRPEMDCMKTFTLARHVLRKLDGIEAP